MFQIYRRHNPAKCKFQARNEFRCKCAIWVDQMVQGRRTRKSLHLRDWNRAQELVRQWEVEGIEPTRPIKQTVEDLNKAFITDCQARKIADETIRKYKLLFRQLDEFCKYEGIQNIENLDLQMMTKFRAG